MTNRLPIYTWVDFTELLEFICAAQQKPWEEVVGTIPEYVVDDYVLDITNTEDWCKEVVDYLNNHGLDSVTIRV